MFYLVHPTGARGLKFRDIANAGVLAAASQNRLQYTPLRAGYIERGSAKRRCFGRQDANQRVLASSGITASPAFCRRAFDCRLAAGTGTPVHRLGCDPIGPRKTHMRIGEARRRNRAQAVAQNLRRIEPHNSRRRVEASIKPFAARASSIAGRCGQSSEPEFTPEDRQEPVRAKPRRNQQPVIRPQFAQCRQPRAGQRMGAPRRTVHNRVA